MDIRFTLESVMAALDTVTVTGRHNCTMIAGVCNDLERVMEVLKDDQDHRQGDVPSAGGHSDC